MGCKTKTGSAAPTARSRVTNGGALLAGIDGRSIVARRYRDIASAITADQAGVVSEAKAGLIRRFAAASCLAEMLEARLANGEEIDVAQHALLCSTLTRLASRIGLDRRARKVVPDLRDYLEGKATATEVVE